LGAMTVLRSLFFIPGPHALEQGVHWFHCEIAQLTEHGLDSHTEVWVRKLHPLPPYDGGVATGRARELTPWPHVAEQLLQGFHEPSWQSTAHGWFEHLRVSSRFGQWLAPSFGITAMARWRVWPPLPQVLEQGPHGDHACILHSSEHVCALQGFSSDVKSHSKPPLRTRFPPPQVLSQGFHAIQSDSLQSAAHFLTLHLAVSTIFPHCLPP
jgi:hypothetical protein